VDHTVHIDYDTCTACELCGQVCPNRAMVKDPTGRMALRPERIALCIRCGQCMAICPSAAIVVEGLDYEQDFFDLAEPPFPDDPFFDLIATRRAIRTFQDRPVPREILEQVVRAIALAPPSFPPVKTELVIIQDPALVRQCLPLMVDLYEHLLTVMANPVTRLVVRRQVGRDTFNQLEHHVVPLMQSRLPELKAGVEDTITRGAPALILFHAGRDAENYQTDLHIALTYGFLAAHALGLGATPIDLIPPAIEKSPELRQLLSIRDSNRVVAALILGYPKYRYRRGILRELKSVRWL
jgi:ferredoxin